MMAETLCAACEELAHPGTITDRTPLCSYHLNKWEFDMRSA